MTLLPDPDAPVYIAGHLGLVGSAVWRQLAAEGYQNLLGWSSSDLDLRDREATIDAVVGAKPSLVVMAAARVGGILANSEQPVDFLNDNIRIQTNLFEAAHLSGVDRLIFLGSSCIYPKLAPQPMREDSLLTGPLEPTNDAYAIAKISGIIAVKSYRHQFGRRWISAMPTNLYGPNDNFDLRSSHVLPAMIRRLHEARQDGSDVTLWGTGSPRREFLHADDLGRAISFLLRHYDEDEHINVGSGVDVSIKELAETVADIVGYEGALGWDPSKPDGTPRKLMDVQRIRALGWEPTIPLESGIRSTYDWYLENHVGLPAG
jgi:GDP-L-fucose synthase